jgi:alcohol dehydrogenase
MIENEYIGKNSLENIKHLSNEKNFKKILIFSGKNSFFVSGAESQLKTILSKFKYEVFYKTGQLPDIDDLKKFITKINNFKPDLIVAIGGGAVLDLAKVSNSLYNCKSLEENIKNSSSKLNNFCELVAIPTTAGSGAETTSNAVMYIDNLKYSVEGKEIKPDHIIIDPNLILSTPKLIAAASGMDAIAQSIESLLSKKSTYESVEYAVKALQYLLPFFEIHINNSNFETAYKMSIGALNAGKAINISKTTAPHAVSYPFTSEHGISHGHAVALTLTDFLKFNFENILLANIKFDLDERYKILFREFKVNDIKELKGKLSKMAEKTGLELNLKKLNINNSDQIENILKGINQQRLSNNPIDIDIGVIRKILVSKI